MSKRRYKFNKDEEAEAEYSRYKNKYDPKYRRRKDIDDLRINSVEILYSNNELRDLKKIANNRCLSKFVRDASLTAVIKEKNKPSISDTETVIQLKRIGNNINQISRQINLYRQDSYFDQHLRELDEYIEELKALIRKFKW